MRITQKMVFDGFLKNINQNRLEMSRLQEYIASGKKITKTSDSPLSFKQARLLEAKIRDKEFFTSQINEAKSTAEVAQQSLDEVADRLIEIKSIVTRGANQVQGSGGYKTMALEVEHLKAELIHSLNVTSSTGYVFAGTDHEQIPFSISDTEAGGVDYLGNSIQVSVEVEKGNFIQPSITGSALRDAQGIDLFETIDQTINALENEEVANLSSQLEQYDTLLAHVSDQAANVGFEWNKMEFLEERQEMITNTFKGELSTIVDTDFAETFSVLQRTEIAFQSAMTVHAQMMNQSLLEYL